MVLKRYDLLWSMVMLFLSGGALLAQEISFVAIADNRSYADQYRLLLRELNDMTVNPEPEVPYPQFLVACGDIDPVAPNMKVYTDTLTYPNLPPYYPVVGNHEFETPSDMSYILTAMIPYLDHLVNRGRQGTYAFDIGEIHCVVLDEYAATDDGEADEDLLAWLQADLNATDCDHVFVFGHEPAFPRYRHIGESLDQFQETRDAFWTMLVMDPRVRAYFCGHTHYYSRMRVCDPASVGTSGFPDQAGGVYQVDCGAAGHSLSDGRLTLVYVHLAEEYIRFRAVTSPRDSAAWGVTDEWTLLGTRRLDMELVEPAPGGEVSGITEVRWTMSGDVGPSSSTVLYVSSNGGATWDTLDTAGTIEDPYSWDTQSYPDGTRYLLRVVVEGKSGFGMVQSEGPFTVNNPGNGAPDVLLKSPVKGTVLSGNVNVEWQAADADGDPMSVTIDASIDQGATWLPLAVEEPNDGLYVWDTERMPNSTHYQLKIRCFDGAAWAEEVSGLFAVQNEREIISDLAVDHLYGTGTGIIAAHIINDASLTGHWYRITFDDTSSALTTYDVRDTDDGRLLVDGAAEMDGVTEGPLFDGIRLQIRNDEFPAVDLDHTGWTVGLSNLECVISLPEIDLGTEVIRGTAHPADYEIRLSDHAVDTSSSFYGAPEIEMYFTVWNVTEHHRVDILYNDLDGDHIISRFDEVYIFENTVSGEPVLTWLLFFTGREYVTLPEAGDVFTFRTLKPFTREDVFEFTPESRGQRGDVNGDDHTDALDLVTVIRHCLQAEVLTGWASWRADCNGDGMVDVLDVMGIVNTIIGRGDCTP